LTTRDAVNVSFPLHICIDFGHGMCPNGWFMSGMSSDCTGVYDTTTMTLKANSTCQSPLPPSTTNPVPIPGTFAPNGVRYIGM
jgi:hypothetical protein